MIGENKMKKALICASSMVVLQLFCEVAMAMSFWKYERSVSAEFPFDFFLGVFSFWGLGILVVSIFYRCTNFLFKNNLRDKRFVSNIFFYSKMRVLFMICVVGIVFSVRVLNGPLTFVTSDGIDIVQANRHILMNSVIYFFIHPTTFYITYLPMLIIFGVYVFRTMRPSASMTE